MKTFRYPVRYGPHNAQIYALPNDHISKHLEEGRFYEAREGELLDVLYKMPSLHGGHFLDIGAHIGNHSVFFSEAMGMYGVAVDANFDTCRTLLDNTITNDVIEMFYGIVWSESEQIMECQDGPEGNSGMARVQLYKDGSAPLYSTTVDELVLECRPLLKRFSLIKIDAEGSEAEIMKGAQETIRRDRPVIAIETNDPELLCPEGYRIIPTKNATPTWVFEPVCG